MTARRTLRSAVAAAAVAASVLLLATGAAAATPPPIPDDPTDPVRAAEYWLDGARIREAWQTTRGDGVTIAVIDTGIGKVPQTFGDAVVGGTDVSGTGTPDGRTPLGAIDGNHGSWVASLAAGRGAPDGTGMIGVAPEADLLSVSVGFGAAAAVPFTEQVAKGIRWAVDNGADIINLSFTTNTLDWDESWDDAFLYAFEHDVVIVVAAGNRGSGTNIIGAPATIPGVLTVGGVDQTGTASIEASTQGITIGISAPSEGLLGVSADGEVVSWSGTSGAAPIVAGIAALIRSAHPGISANDVINRIIKTAMPVPDAQQPRDPLYGFGLVDAAAAVSADIPSVDKNPMGDLAEWIRLFRRAESEPLPEPTIGPVEVPPLPDADAPTEAGSPLLPSADSLRYGTLPLIALTVPGILVALGVTAAARRIRSARVPVRQKPDSEE
ncbi:S8 family serine peptidase [Microbacterium sp. p3-SID336]|uniref:S8 family peptidase n=1 Tax=Microbacterium sp. p3-SID336 TaxID=2916212 RepID=UPI0021A38AFC|nr:S8 family serine peptidase [Microbacterium sp. p3-SID336]MCT1479898.1 S8 family serine peptidase [Microbacterium sp. p3-SID336]